MDARMLDGKVAIVSGASYGMGQTMAELFAKEGAKVVMTARGQEKLDAAFIGNLMRTGMWNGRLPEELASIGSSSEATRKIIRTG